MKTLRVNRFIGRDMSITPGTTRVKWTDGTISQIPVSGELTAANF